MLTVVLCTDGSPLAQTALSAGFPVLAQADRVIIAMAMAAGDPVDAFASGMAGGVAIPLPPGETQRVHDERIDAVREQLADAAAALGLPNAELTVISGPPGPSICALAESSGAAVIVLGTRGNSGLRRAMLGSVSDFVVRNAPCPVLITAPRSEQVRAASAG